MNLHIAGEFKIWTQITANTRSDYLCQPVGQHNFSLIYTLFHIQHSRQDIIIALRTIIKLLSTCCDVCNHMQNLLWATFLDFTFRFLLLLISNEAIYQNSLQLYIPFLSPLFLCRFQFLLPKLQIIFSWVLKKKIFINLNQRAEIKNTYAITAAIIIKLGNALCVCVCVFIIFSVYIGT